MKIRELYVGDRFTTSDSTQLPEIKTNIPRMGLGSKRLWTLIDYNEDGDPICRAHSSTQHGYIGDVVCYFPKDTEVDYVPVELP